VLGRQLVLIRRGIDFFANTALLYRFVNIDFSNPQCDDAPFFCLLDEKPFPAAVG
jgi:hypothetical protein